MWPGTISGTEHPDDRLGTTPARERADGRGYVAPDPPPDSPGVAGATFLIGSILGCVAAVVLLARPTMEAVAAALRAAGVSVLGPSAYAARGAWARAAREDPWSFFVQAASIQLVFMAFAVVAALLMRGGFRQRLGLVRPRGGWRVLGLAVLIEVLVFAFGIASVMTFLPADHAPPARQVQIVEMLARAPLDAWLACFAAMTLLPGVAEEALFRGLIQRRLMTWWAPWVAIAFTGLVFTAGHPPLVRALMLLPGCVWLGYVAYRCGSVLPGMVLHVLTNAGAGLLIRFGPAEPSTGPEPARWALALVALGSGAACAWLLVLLHRWTRDPGPPRDADPVSAVEPGAEPSPLAQRGW